MPLKKVKSEKMEIIFIETLFEAGESVQNANKEDIVPYSGFITFPPHATTALL